jgi:hypothetical protein
VLWLLVLKQKFTKRTDTWIRQEKKEPRSETKREKALLSSCSFSFSFFFLCNILDAIRFFFFSLFFFLIKVKQALRKKGRKKSVIQCNV